VAPWITVLSRHTVFTKRVIHYKFTFVWFPWNKAPRTGSRHIWHTVPFLWPREEHRWQSSWVDSATHCFLWLLLLRLAAAVVPLLLLLPQNSLLTSLVFTPDSEAMSANRISLMASSSSFIYFFPATARDPQSSASFRLLCTTRRSFRNIIPVRYERLLQWQQNRSKAMMWLLYKNSSYSRVPKTLLLDWQLYFAYYYPTTPTDYPSTTTGMSVGPSVAVNIEFCGYLPFLSISFDWITWVQYATDNLSGQQLEFAS